MSSDALFLPAGAARPDNLKTRYVYKAQVDRIYDGDTVTLSFDLGLRVWTKGVSCRLYGIDTPEIRGTERPQGVMARDHLGKLCQRHAVNLYDRSGRLTDSLPPTLMARTRKKKSGDDDSGKYGRWLVTLIGWDWDRGVPVNLNELMVEDGHAVSYYL